MGSCCSSDSTEVAANDSYVADDAVTELKASLELVTAEHPASMHTSSVQRNSHDGQGRRAPMAFRQSHFVGGGGQRNKGPAGAVAAYVRSNLGLLPPVYILTRFQSYGTGGKPSGALKLSSPTLHELTKTVFQADDEEEEVALTMGMTNAMVDGAEDVDTEDIFLTADKVPVLLTDCDVVNERYDTPAFQAHLLQVMEQLKLVNLDDRLYLSDFMNWYETTYVESLIEPVLNKFNLLGADGTLTRNHATIVLGQICDSVDDDVIEATVDESLFVDDKTLSVTKQQFYSYFVGEFRLQRLQHAFGVTSSRHTGGYGPEEVKFLMTFLGLYGTSDELSQLFGVLDKNHNAVLEMDEFLDFALMGRVARLTRQIKHLDSHEIERA